jgi:hypothetical protein
MWYFWRNITFSFHHNLYSHKTNKIVRIALILLPILVPYSDSSAKQEIKEWVARLEPEELSRYSERLLAGRPGSILGVGKKFVSAQQRLDRLWGPPSLLSNGYRGSSCGDKAAGAWSCQLTSI